VVRASAEILETRDISFAAARLAAQQRGVNEYLRSLLKEWVYSEAQLTLGFARLTQEFPSPSHLPKSLLLARCTMAASTVVPTTSTVTINVFDGTRQPFTAGKSILYTITDGNQKQLFRKEVATPSLTATGLPFFDNFGDNYCVLAYADGFQQAGFVPVKLSPRQPVAVDLMLIPRDPQFNFADASWDAIKVELAFLASDVDDAAGRDRYEMLMENKPKSLAALLNITTAMSQIFLPIGTPLDYIKRVLWDESLQQDRFFAWCDPQMVEQVRIAAAQGEFAPENAPWILHPGATASWKQVQFGEANVQLTFHENDKQEINGLTCIKVEPDIDYYKDPAAHIILEVLPNAITGGLTNPDVVYVLRWIAGRRAGIPEFAPPYIIV
jgi:hypothetical protein